LRGSWRRPPKRSIDLLCDVFALGDTGTQLVIIKRAIALEAGGLIINRKILPKDLHVQVFPPTGCQ